jgi:ring-1,2-phenylacetyl-CoA epoxidase subunit PaaC
VKEAAYHLKWSSEWMIRLGDGTEESRRRLDKAIATLWRYQDELLASTPAEAALQALGVLPDYQDLAPALQAHAAHVLAEATVPLLTAPGYRGAGGKLGRHSEHLGYLLAELQYMQRTYPGLQW